LHGVIHLTLSLQPVSPDFNLSPAYLQSLMMLVVLVLGIGFSMLVVLALFLCLVISFLPPVTSPPIVMRLAVIAAAFAMGATALKSMQGNHAYSHGMHELSSAVESLESILAEVDSAASTLGAAIDDFALHVVPLYACEACFSADSERLGIHSLVSAADVARTSGGGIAENGTGYYAGHERGYSGNRSGESVAGAGEFRNSSICRAMESAISDARLGHGVVRSAAAGPTATARVRDLISRSTGWHAWAASLPCFALLTTSAAVALGALRGRRNVLVSSQFFAVIIWWMMCAVVSVEFAIAVGLADACLDPVATVQRVLRQFATDRRATPDMRTYDAVMHRILDCNLSDPMADALDALDAGVDSLLSNLSNVTRCSPFVDVLSSSLATLQQRTAATRHSLADCGADGTIGRLFKSGVEQGLCTSAPAGITAVFVWQAACGAMLLLLTALLPWLWHSHHLPPLSYRLLRIRALQLLPRRQDDGTASSTAPLIYSAHHPDEEAASAAGGDLGHESSSSSAPSEAQSSTMFRHHWESADAGAASHASRAESRARQCSSHEVL